MLYCLFSGHQYMKLDKLVFEVYTLEKTIIFGRVINSSEPIEDQNKKRNAVFCVYGNVELMT